MTDSLPVTPFPPRLVNELRALAYIPGSVRSLASADPRRPVSRFVADSHLGPLLVEVAHGPSGGHRRLAIEADGRAWAYRQGIPTPHVYAVDPGGEWLISQYVTPGRARGSSYITYALEAAATVASATDAPPTAGRSTWRAPRRTVPLRAARNVLGGLPLSQWRAARAEAATLPRDTAAHGDFYWRNVLHVETGVMIVDWEYVGLAAYGTDQLRLWSAQQDADDREQVMEHLMQTTPRARWPQIGKLALWLSLRLLGENLSAPRRYQRAADREHARAMVSEAQGWARNLAESR